MEGEKRKRDPQDGTGRDSRRTLERIREYDFFVTRDGGESAEAAPADRGEKAKAKGRRNKSTTFFLSD